MKKIFFTAIIAACLALTGCSGVSQQEYDDLQTKHENYVLDSDAKIKALQESNDELERLLAIASTSADNNYRNYKSIEGKYLDIVNSEEYQWFSRLSDEEIATLKEAHSGEIIPPADPQKQDISNATSTVTSTDYQPTLGEKNALNAAKNYLNFMSFSYKGLVEQLKYEGYSESEAMYGVDNCGADWYEQAAEKAASYLDIMSFSKSGLIEQLEYEGFTHEQAAHGAEAVGY